MMSCITKPTGLCRVILPSEPSPLFELDLYTEFCCGTQTRDEAGFYYKISKRD